MENEKEVNPLSSGSEEVSSHNATDGGAPTPATPSLEETPASVVMIACKQCAASFERKGMNSKYCAACAPSRQTIARKKRADGKKAASYVYDSGVEPTKSEALTLLEERGIKHPHVQSTVYKLL